MKKIKKASEHTSFSETARELNHLKKYVCESVDPTRSELVNDLINWGDSLVQYTTLTGNTTLVDSNLKIGTKFLIITGNYTLAFPSYYKVIAGTYDGTVDNFVQIVCTNASSGAEEVWISISQEV